MKKLILIATMVTTLSMGLTACGNKDESSQEAGIVSMDSIVTEATEESSLVDSTTKIIKTTTQTTTKKSPKKTTKKTAKSTSKKDIKTTRKTTKATSNTTKKTTKLTTKATTKKTTKATTRKTTKATTTTPKVVKGSISSSNLKVTYNKCTFGVGDSFDKVKNKLGKQPAPSQKLPSCIGNEIVDEYYFYGMTIQVNKGKIFSIDIMDNGFYGNQTPATIKGISCNKSTKSNVINAYGNPQKSDEYNLYYSKGTLSLQVSVFSGSVGRIWITDSKLG